MKSQSGCSRLLAAWLLCVSLLIHYGLMGAEVFVEVSLTWHRPQQLAVNMGDTVTWRVTDPSDYTVVNYENGWRSPILSGMGATYSRQFEAAGDYTYRSYFFLEHNNVGQIVVLPWTNQPPAVTINTPVDGMVFTRVASFTISATVTNDPALVQRVEFYAGADLLGIATNAPYRLRAHNILFEGDHVLTARIIDLQGGIGLSRPVSIRVEPGGTARINRIHRLPTGETRLHINTPSAENWVPEISEDLLDWRGAPPDGGGSIYVDETSIKVPQRFYRLREEVG